MVREDFRVFLVLTRTLKKLHLKVNWRSLNFLFPVYRDLDPLTAKIRLAERLEFVAVTSSDPKLDFGARIPLKMSPNAKLVVN